MFVSFLSVDIEDIASSSDDRRDIRPCRFYVTGMTRKYFYEVVTCSQGLVKSGRSERIRTSDPYNPI